MATQVGLICGAETGTVYAVINPDDDSELDNPRWLLIQIVVALREPLTLAKVGIGEYMDCTSHSAVQQLAKTRLGIA